MTAEKEFVVILRLGGKPFFAASLAPAAGVSIMVAGDMAEEDRHVGVFAVVKAESRQTVQRWLRLQGVLRGDLAQIELFESGVEAE